MNALRALRVLTLAAVPALLLAACGGGDDLDDRLDVADPSYRFVHAAPLAPEVTLYRGADAQSDATNVSYGYVGNYADTSTDPATWTLRTTAGNVDVGSVDIDPARGNRYTIVALPTPVGGESLAVITDPYDKPLTSESSRVRLLNVSPNSGSVDLYMNAPGTNVATVQPLVAATGYGAAGPSSGNDSVDIPGGTWQVTLTSAGTKTVLFQGTATFGNDQDVLLLSVADSVVPGDVAMLIKVDGTAAATEVAPNP